MKYLMPILGLICLLSCGKPQAFEYKTLKNFKVENLGFEQSTLAFELVYFNPNNFGVTLKKVDCEVYINKNYLGKYLLDTTMHIDKKAEFSLPSKMKVDMRNIFKNGFNALLSKEVTLDVKGVTSVSKAGIKVNVPVNYSGRHSFSIF